MTLYPRQSTRGIPGAVLFFLGSQGVLACLNVLSLVTAFYLIPEIDGVGGLNLLLKAVQTLWVFALLRPAATLEPGFLTIVRGYCGFSLLSAAMVLALGIARGQAEYSAVAYGVSFVWWAAWIVYFGKYLPLKNLYQSGSPPGP